ncbi:protein max isoform X2 [Drosophila guanche]|uniref:protein max isoform X2 n=1 Tax=Drosophila guanche TaxID=7266 RepID=UPI001470A7BA|nr:protein max isoform X2 [Drosophila guanche]XP_034659519.1 protein max isoform X2 [Drosophila subobscura]
MSMSDDDRDIDIESDAEKRAHHNALERRRRDHIKESFTNLREAVPTLKGEKASRAQILKRTTECIQTMRKKINDNQKDIDEIKKQNIQLDQQIRAMEGAMNGDGYADLQSEDDVCSDDVEDEDLELPDSSRRNKKMKTFHA